MTEDKIQGGIDWFIQRLGKITSSEIYVLTKSHKEAMTDEELAEFKSANPKSRVTTKEVPFADSTFTYLNRKVMENFLPIRSKSQDARNSVEEYIDIHKASSRATDFGTFWEDEARKRYAELMGYEVFEVGFTPYDKYPQLAGGSPDGMIREEKGVIEIKAPFTLEKHLQHFLYETPQDLKEKDEQYYWQCVGNMLFTDTEFCDFISFNPYISVSKQLKILRIPRTNEDITFLQDRIDLAVEYIKKQIKEINNSKSIII